MSVPNFSSLAGLEVAEKFVCGGLVGVSSKHLLFLTETLVAYQSCFELGKVKDGF